MDYQLTMEDYISLINYYSLHKISTINCNEMRITNCAGSNGGNLIFDGPEINCTCNINEKIITKNTYPHAHGSYIEVMGVELVPPTELALRIFEFNKLKEKDIEGLNLLCLSFIEDFKELDLSLNNWNGGKLHIPSSRKKKLYYNSDWNYSISESLSFFGIGSEIFVEYFSDGKERLCKYSKFKDIEAFL